MSHDRPRAHEPTIRSFGTMADDHPLDAKIRDLAGAFPAHFPITRAWTSPAS